MNYTIRVTLLGRRDGGPVVGVGTERTVGTFRTRDLAEVSLAAWQRDPSFLWSAEIQPGAGEVGLVVEREHRHRCHWCKRGRGHSLRCPRRWS